MFKTVLKINWDNMKEAFPSFITIIFMPFTFSIAYGIIAGLVVHFVMVFFDVLFDRLFPPKVNSLNNDKIGSRHSDFPLISRETNNADYASLSAKSDKQYV